MERLLDITKSKGRLMLVLSLILIVVGVVMAVVTINQFRSGVEDEQDKLLAGAVSSFDYNINDAVSKFEVQQESYVKTDRFQEALSQWQDADENMKSQEAQRLSQMMQNSPMANQRIFDDMFVITRKGNVLASGGEADYKIGDNITGNLYRCVDFGGNELIAVETRLAGRNTCYGILDSESIYYTTLQRVNDAAYNIMILQPTSGTLYYQKKGAIGSSDVSDFAKADKLAAEEAEILCKSQDTGFEIKESYEKKVKNRSLTTRVLVRPAGLTDNRIFGISASADYDVLNSLIGGTISKLIIDFIIAAIGIFLVILILLRSRRERQAVDLELEALKEKNQQMEELNQKTQELAHHQRLETIGTMTSSIAHEFNNLLTPIMGYSMMTLEKLPQDDELIYDDVLEIYNASVKAKDIISRLSELSRKNTEIVFRKLNPDDLANKVLHVAAPLLPKNVDIFRELHCEDRYINGNEVQLSQLLLNLIINAFQAMKDMEGEVTVSTEARDGYIMFGVRDNGPGIPEDIKEKVFDPFFTTKESGAGTGLGLAIVLQAAEDHEGRVELESEEGKGTAFRIFIPEMEVTETEYDDLDDDFMD